MMRTTFQIVLCVLSSLFVAGSASAKIMDTWTRISLQFTNLARAQANDTAIGVSTLNTSGSGMHLNTLSLGQGTLPGLSLNTVLPVTDPAVSGQGIDGVVLTRIRPGSVPGPQNNLGVLAPISGAVQSTVTPPAGLGTVPSTGMMRLCVLFNGCVSNLPIPVGETINGVAQGSGAGGILTFFTPSTIRISVLGAPYTVKTVSITQNTGGLQTFTDRGFAHGPLSNTSSTGQTSGVLQLVTATQVHMQGVPGNADNGWFTRILVHFIPEPSLLLLFGSGAVAMAVLGRKRMRR